MSFQKRQPQINWRDYLTSDEASELAALETEAVKTDHRRRELTAAIRPIRNRAEKRAEAAKRKVAA